MISDNINIKNHTNEMDKQKNFKVEVVETLTRTATVITDIYDVSKGKAHLPAGEEFDTYAEEHFSILSLLDALQVYLKEDIEVAENDDDHGAQYRLLLQMLSDCKGWSAKIAVKEV